MDNSEEILEFIRQNGPTTPQDLIANLAMSRSGIFLELAKLTSSGRLLKQGKLPNTIYVHPKDVFVQPEGSGQVPVPVEVPKEYKMGVFICKRLGLDPMIVQAKHDGLHSYLLGGYTYKASRATTKFPNLFSRLLACVCELVIWILALVTALITQQLKFKEETLANPQQANAWIWLVLLVFIVGAAAGSVGYDQWLRFGNSSLRQQKLKEEVETLKKNQERLEKNILRYQVNAWEIRQKYNQVRQQLEEQRPLLNTSH